MRKYLLAVGLVAFQTLVALSPLLPRIKALWGDKADAVEVLSVNFAILAVALPVMLLAELRGHRETLSSLRGDGTEVRWQKANEFYQQFQAEMKAAKDYVDIAYFAAYPPLDTADEARKRYYNSLAGLMKGRQDVQFRRLVRDSKKNAPWIRQILNEMKGARNFALAIVPDAEQEDQSLALSVQVVDDERVWLVAVKSHEPPGGPRDIFVRSPIVAAGLRSYYERVWSRGAVLMKQGNLTADGEKYAGGVA